MVKLFLSFATDCKPFLTKGPAGPTPCLEKLPVTLLTTALSPKTIIRVAQSYEPGILSWTANERGLTRWIDQRPAGAILQFIIIESRRGRWKGETARPVVRLETASGNKERKKKSREEGDRSKGKRRTWRGIHA